MSKISKIGVVGAGNMGSGIVQKIAQEGLDVVMVDTGEEFVKRGMDNIKRLLREGAERKIFRPDDIDCILSRITGTTDLQALADADLVIEAVFEDKGIKTALFKRLDGICMDKTILATNTSSFYVREFAEATSRPDRVIGLHYFYHPAKNRLLEVIPHGKTSAQTIDRALLALKLVTRIIDQQAKASPDERIEIELDHLKEIFATADALEGLSSPGRKKPEYKGL